MSVDDELARWATSWRGSSMRVDVDQLLKKTVARTRRMRIMVTAELLGSLVAIWQVIRLLNVTLEPPGRIWAWCLLGLLVVLQVVFLVMRRNIWSAQGESVTHLLELSQRRARFAMKYALLNASVFLVAATSLAPFAYSAWQAARSDPARLHDVLVSITAIGAVLIAGLTVTLWYWRKQRAHERKIGEVLNSIR